MVGLVLILLSERLIEEAEIVAREFGSNCSGEQGEIIEDLLDALDQNDEAKMRAALGANCLLALDWEYVTVIKNIAVDTDGGQGVRPRTRDDCVDSVIPRIPLFPLFRVLEQEVKSEFQSRVRRHFPSIKRKKKAGEAKEKEDAADQNESSKDAESTEGEGRKKLVRQKPSRQVWDRVHIL